MDLSGLLFDINKKAEINAVHSDEINDILNDIGYLDKIENGVISCEVCGKKITIDNLSKIIPKQTEKERGDYAFRCNNLKCYLTPHPEAPQQKEFEDLSKNMKEVPISAIESWEKDND